MQFFWILSDGTVKEISKQDYFKLKDKKHFVGWVDPSPKTIYETQSYAHGVTTPTGPTDPRTGPTPGPIPGPGPLGPISRMQHARAIVDTGDYVASLRVSNNSRRIKRYDAFPERR